MEINEKLKNNLIFDVEYVLDTALTRAQKISLKRHFEITIGTHISQLNLDKK